MKIFKPNFIGIQFARLRMGMSYATLLMSATSALALLKLAFPIKGWMLIAIIPCILIFMFGVGYMLDRLNINALDQAKMRDLQHKYLNIGDIKTQEFFLALIRGLKKDTIDEEYSRYKKKWRYK